jgi:hypothetical protein
VLCFDLSAQVHSLTCVASLVIGSPEDALPREQGSSGQRENSISTGQGDRQTDDREASPGGMKHQAPCQEEKDRIQNGEKQRRLEDHPARSMEGKKQMQGGNETCEEKNGKEAKVQG